MNAQLWRCALLLLPALALNAQTVRHSSTVQVFTLRTEQAIPAQIFADSLGLNVHLSYDGTLYKTDFPRVLAALQNLHVRHVRDGLVDFGPGPNAFYTAYQQLAANGIHADFITSVGQDPSLLQAYPARVGGPGAVDALEAPNEYDTHGDLHWPATLRASLQLLQEAVHGTPPMPGIALIGPSLVNEHWNQPSANSYAQLGPVSALSDVGNLHNYPGGHNPGTPGWTPEGYGSIRFAITSARSSWGELPLITTETGYRDDPGSPDSLPDDMIARYMPRLLLEQFLHGIRRTYLYELADDPSSGGLYGLLRADGSQKPAYRALANLMDLVAGQASSPAPSASLRWALAGVDSNLHHLLLARQDGTLLLALWVELPALDDDHHPLTVPPQQARLRFARALHITAIHHWQSDGATCVQRLGRQTSALNLPVSDLLTVLELKPQP